MWKTKEGSTGRLIQLCIGYFVFYVITGLSVKYFLGKADMGFPGMSDMQYLVYSTIGGNAFALGVVILLGWYKIQSNGSTTFLGMTIPEELLYIIPSGICTAVVIPTTTLMYSLPISVMVAMVIMRGSVIVISRIVDEIQIRKGILKKRIYAEENIAVLFAIIAVAINVFFGKEGEFDFIYNVAAMTILTSYIIAYFIRIYIMNYYKNTRAKGVKQDNKGFFGIEQISASITMMLGGILVYLGYSLWDWSLPQVSSFVSSFTDIHPMWGWAILAGTAFGIVAFFSVFIFMFKGRTATFAGLVNRLTSLIAGTAATLLFYVFFGGKFPGKADWLSLLFILIAVGFISAAEKKRTAELKATHELDDNGIDSQAGTAKA
jgi:hypothetical protein